MNEEQKDLYVPIEWVIQDDTPNGYATNIVVQHTEHEYIISFFEIKPPIILGTPEERYKQAENLKSIKARCIAQITVAAERMPEFLRVIIENMNTSGTKVVLEQNDANLED